MERKAKRKSMKLLYISSFLTIIVRSFTWRVCKLSKTSQNPVKWCNGIIKTTSIIEIGYSIIPFKRLMSCLRKHILFLNVFSYLANILRLLITGCYQDILESPSMQHMLFKYIQHVYSYIYVRMTWKVLYYATIFDIITYS